MGLRWCSECVREEWRGGVGAWLLSRSSARLLGSSHGPLGAQQHPERATPPPRPCRPPMYEPEEYLVLAQALGGLSNLQV